MYIIALTKILKKSYFIILIIVIINQLINNLKKKDIEYTIIFIAK